MTSLPPQAAGQVGNPDQATLADAPETDPLQAEQRRAAPPRTDGGYRMGGPTGMRPLPPVRPSGAPVELSLDLRGTPADKVLPRILGALDRVAPDVALLVSLRDTPEYVGVVATVFQALRSRGYISDSSRFPAGVQRLRIYQRGQGPRQSRRDPGESETPAQYAPVPVVDMTVMTPGTQDTTDMAVDAGQTEDQAAAESPDQEFSPPEFPGREPPRGVPPLDTQRPPASRMGHGNRARGPVHGGGAGGRGARPRPGPGFSESGPAPSGNPDVA